jgi:hypothetical protein
VKILVYIIHCFIVFCSAYLLSKRWRTTTSKLFWGSLFVHLGGGVAVGLIYSHYYSANDTWQFFNDATKLTSIAKTDFMSYVKLMVDLSDDQLYPGVITGDFRSLIFVKMLSVFCLISRDSYWISSVYFSFIAFAASWFLYHKMICYVPRSERAAALAILFFPSIVFWSSGIEKETLTLASLYFLSGIFLEWVSEQKIKKWFWLPTIMASFVLWALKYYWAGVFFISVFSALILLFLAQRLPQLKTRFVSTYVILFIVIGAGVSTLHPNFYINRFLEVLVSNHNTFVSISRDNNLIHFYELKPTIVSVVINSPFALVSGIFRPLIGEGQGWLGFIASIENFLLLLLFLSKLMSLRKNISTRVSVLFLAVGSYCVVLCVCLALSTPNLGTLSRYRVGFLPFLVFIIAHENPLVDWVAKKWKGSN